MVREKEDMGAVFESCPAVITQVEGKKKFLYVFAQSVSVQNKGNMMHLCKLRLRVIWKLQSGLG